MEPTWELTISATQQNFFSQTWERSFAVESSCSSRRHRFRSTGRKATAISQGRSTRSGSSAWRHGSRTCSPRMALSWSRWATPGCQAAPSGLPKATWQVPGCALVVCETERRRSVGRAADASASLRRPRSSANRCGDRNVVWAQSRPDGRPPSQSPSDNQLTLHTESGTRFAAANRLYQRTGHGFAALTGLKGPPYRPFPAPRWGGGLRGLPARLSVSGSVSSLRCSLRRRLRACRLCSRR